MLSARENFHRMMRGESPDRLPLDVWMTGPALDIIEHQRGTRDYVQAFDLAFGNVGCRWPVEAEAWREAYLKIGFHLPPNATIYSCGYVDAAPPRESLGEAWHLRDMLHPMAVATRREQLESLPWPNVSDPQWFSHLPADVATIHQQGRAAMGHMACTIFESAWYVRGMDVLLLDLLEDNGIGEFLLDWFTERSIAGVRAYVEAGVDVIMLGDDVGSQHGMLMSSSFWREHFKPRLERVVRAIRETETQKTWIVYHSDGRIEPVIDDLAEIGIDILNPVQPECMDVDAVIREHRHHLAFYGMIGTQSTMPFGKPDDVRRAVHRVRDHYYDGARVVVAPTHVLEPDVPFANTQALVDACAEPL